MKVFCFKLLLFFIPVIVVFVSIELYLRSIPNSYKIKEEKFMRNINQYNTLVLGSSLSYFGINPAYFDKPGYNMANVSQDLYYDYMILSKHIDKLKNVKNIIISIGYSSFESKGVEPWRVYEYNRYYKIPSRSKFDQFSINNYSLTSLYIVSKRLTTVLFNRSYYNTDCLNENGWYDVGAAWGCGKASDKGAIDRISAVLKNTDKSMIEQNSRYFELIIKKCLSRDIKPKIVILPVYKTFYNNIRKDTYIRMVNIVNAASLKYNLKVCNYFYDKRFEKSDFSDNDHLCSSGAAKISKIINDDILKNE